MREKQRTIETNQSCTGIGLHTGQSTTLTFKPAPPDAGVAFIRTDLPDSPTIPALIDNVVDISRGTTLGVGDDKVHTVEHVLAAAAGLEIDNLIIELDGPEPPVGDGSAMLFVQALQAAGYKDQDAARDYLIVDSKVGYKEDERGVEIVALPTDDFRITVMIDYGNPTLGSQHTGLFELGDEFVKEFAPARTFCFLQEVEELARQDLIRGGSMKNAVVIVDHDVQPGELDKLKEIFGVEETITIQENGLLNGAEFRFKNEPCRHKLLDLLGDLALVGVPMRAQILAARSGHAANIEFAKKLRKLYEKQQLTRKYQTTASKDIVFDIQAISKILPHRYPLLLVDRIIEFDGENRIVGIKNVTINEPFFVGHFPDHPVMPGVLIVEAMGQVGGVLMLNTIENPEEKIVYFMGVDRVKWRRPVVPGDQIRFELEMIRRRGTIIVMAGKAYVDGKLVAEAELMAKVMDR
jgi:UDP-3-O-[3-hydroxymyristoyl] N-acetylglucosamine deacetylase / 3-hydroxyacyl-[acyl-carrier-protein] dehydratase